jgi:hypothetical protein
MAITVCGGLVLFTLTTSLRRDPTAARPELWLAALGWMSGLAVTGLRMRRVPSLAGIVLVPLLGLGAGFAWMGRHFPEARPLANVIGLAYLATIVGLGALAGMASWSVGARLIRGLGKGT